ncbi:hypothetical protein [Methanococcoides burtonii]|nr:hypothetical protein [Methanococcoides burtonii]
MKSEIKWAIFFGCCILSIIAIDALITIGAMSKIIPLEDEMLTLIHNFISTVLDSALVIITLVYVIITAEILKDSQQTRKVSIVQKQLDDFYIPMKEIYKELAFFPLGDNETGFQTNGTSVNYIEHIVAG